jgi:hypothetical protein
VNKTGFSVVTNATINDGIRLKHFIPAIIEQFDPWIREVIVVVDHQPEQGRIKNLHGDQPLAISLQSIKEAVPDSRVRFVDLDYNQAEAISAKWFGVRDVNRCQAGTPIFAFLFAIEQADYPWIIKCDCDIFFADNGMINYIQQYLSSYDLVQLPMLNADPLPFSTRAFVINRETLIPKLPIYPARLDLVRGLIRQMKGRSTYLALEQILHYNINSGKLKQVRMNNETGYSIHIGRRQDFLHIEPVLEKFKHRNIPASQLNEVHDFVSAHWHNNAS